MKVVILAGGKGSRLDKKGKFNEVEGKTKATDCLDCETGKYNDEEGKENEVTEVKFMCKYLVKMIAIFY